MSITNNKRIAYWLGVSATTLYRWRSAGLLPHRLASAEEAEKALLRIELAHCEAASARPRGQLGRTGLDAVAKYLGNQS